MNSPAKPLILSVDDNQVIVKLIELFLTSSGYRVIIAQDGFKALEILGKVKPDLILLDVMMPGMDGYEVCARLQKSEQTAYIPVIFVTALGEEQDKARAFSVGAVDYLVKPIKKDVLIDKVSTHIKTNTRWKKLRKSRRTWDQRILPADFIQFKEFMFDQLKVEPEKRLQLSDVSAAKIYSLASELGSSKSEIAQFIAEFLKLPCTSHIDSADVQLGILPTPFCKANHVVAISDASNRKAFVLSNPFDWDILDNLKKFAGLDQTSRLIISEPENIDLLFKYDTPGPSRDGSVVEEEQKIGKPGVETVSRLTEAEAKKHPSSVSSTDPRGSS